MQLQIKNPDATEEVTALRTLFEDYLKCTYWSEQELVSVFTDTILQIQSKDFSRMLLQHAENARMHCSRIEKVFESIGIKIEGKKSETMESLIQEMENIEGQIESGPVRDAALIAKVQHITHCEIASYGTLRSFAITLKEENVVTLLELNLDEEKQFDRELSVVAEAYINDEAANKEY